MNRLSVFVPISLLACLLTLPTATSAQPPASADGSGEVDFLLEALWNSESRVRQNAVKRISELDEKPYEALVNYLSTGNQIEAATAAVVFQHVAGTNAVIPKEVRDKLYEILENRPAVPWRWNITANLLATVPKLAGDSLKDHVDLWIWGVEQSSPYIQLPSLLALQQTGEEGGAAVGALLSLYYRDRTPLTNLVIDSRVVADWQIGIEQPIPAYDSLTILETLVAVKADANQILGPLTSLTYHDSEYVRLDAAAMLGKLDLPASQTAPSRRAVEVLRDLATKLTSKVRESAARELGEINGAVEARLSVLTMLLLNDKKDDVRTQAAQALGKMGEAAKPALEQLEEALRIAKLDTEDAERVIAEAIEAIRGAKE